MDFKTQRLAEKKLRQCRRLMRIAHKNLSDLKSPTIDDMPSNPPTGNPHEERVINKASATKDLYEIYKAITWLKEEERELLLMKYFDFEEPNDKAIYYMMHLEERQYYRLKRRAIRHFAESYLGCNLFANS